MSFIKQHTLKYTTLSPVHIGADETYEPGNYVIDDESGALYSFDSQAAFAGLEDIDRKQLLSIVSGKPDDSMLTRVQAFFHNNRDKLIGIAHSPVPTAKGVASLYQKRIGKTAQLEGRGKRVNNKLGIERTFYNPANSKPIFPGSSIKGAIRTALLDQENNGKKPYDRQKNQTFQTDILQGSFHTDPLRLIGISDAHWQGDETLPTTQVQFAVNRKREPVMKDGKLIQSQAERSNLYQLLECVPALGYQLLQGSMQIQDVSQITQDDRKLPKQKYQWNIQDIARACNAFYFTLFQQELTKLKERNYLHKAWLENLDRLLQQGLLKRMQNGEVFLLRLGRHSGAECVTLNGARSIKIMQGKGNKPVWEAKPKTWWLAANDTSSKTDMLPFGWVLVEINAKDTNISSDEWQQNKASDLADWYRQQLQKQGAFKEQAKQRQTLAAARQAQEKLVEQQAREQQLAEQQRLASLSPLEQELEAFLKPIQPQEHDTRLLQELNASHWQGEDAKLVAKKVQQLMEQAGKWMPGFSGRNKNKLKFKERSLKIQGYLNA